MAIDGTEMQDAGEQAGFGRDAAMPVADLQDYPEYGMMEEEGEGVSFDEEIFSDEGAETGHVLADEEQVQEEARRPRSSDWKGDAVIGTFEKHVEAFVEETEDFDEALQYLAQRRNAQLAALSAVDRRLQDDGLREQQMKGELQQIISAALQRGDNPARMIYAIARGYGFQPGKEVSGGGMTLKKLAAMSEREFGRWYEKSGETFRKLMGG